MKTQFSVLGCSVSTGVPAIGNDWGDCDPSEPKNYRERPCAMIRTEKTALLIDTGPDFRSQINRIGVLPHIDGVLYTHAHSDHITGIDDLRQILSRQGGGHINIYSDPVAMTQIKQRYQYMFQDNNNYKQVLCGNVIDPASYNREMIIGDIRFTPFYQNHGDCDSLGFRFGNMAYCADFLSMPQESIDVLKGIDVWIADGAGHYIEDHKTHAPLSRLYEMNREIGARQVYVIGLSKFMDYQTLISEMPAPFIPAYDGLTLDVVL